MKRSSVCPLRLSVRSIIRLQPRRAAGLLPSAVQVEDIDRQRRPLGAQQ